LTGEHVDNHAGYSDKMLMRDSGGIRGIVELKVLAEIQKHLGGLPINNFFDLVVGTRYAFTEGKLSATN
jgi:patatin-like phospholipase/acyl hydrolase